LNAPHLDWYYYILVVGYITDYIRIVYELKIAYHSEKSWVQNLVTPQSDTISIRSLGSSHTHTRTIILKQMWWLHTTQNSVKFIITRDIATWKVSQKRAHVVLLTTSRWCQWRSFWRWCAEGWTWKAFKCALIVGSYQLWNKWVFLIRVLDYYETKNWNSMKDALLKTSACPAHHYSDNEASTYL
jgi:hypothetical protein